MKQLTKEQKKEILLTAIDIIADDKTKCICDTVRQIIHAEYDRAIYYENAYIQCLFGLNHYRPDNITNPNAPFWDYTKEGQAQRLRVLNKLAETQK